MSGMLRSTSRLNIAKYFANNSTQYLRTMVLSNDNLKLSSTLHLADYVHETQGNKNKYYNFF